MPVVTVGSLPVLELPGRPKRKWAGIHPRKGEENRLTIQAGSLRRPVSDTGGDRGR